MKRPEPDGVRKPWIPECRFFQLPLAPQAPPQGPALPTVIELDPGYRWISLRPRAFALGHSNLPYTNLGPPLGGDPAVTGAAPGPAPARELPPDVPPHASRAQLRPFASGSMLVGQGWPEEKEHVCQALEAGAQAPQPLSARVIDCPPTPSPGSCARDSAALLDRWYGEGYWGGVDAGPHHLPGDVTRAIVVHALNVRDRQDARPELRLLRDIGRSCKSLAVLARQLRRDDALASFRRDAFEHERRHLQTAQIAVDPDFLVRRWHALPNFCPRRIARAIKALSKLDLDLPMATLLAPDELRLKQVNASQNRALDVLLANASQNRALDVLLARLGPSIETVTIDVPGVDMVRSGRQFLERMLQLLFPDPGTAAGRPSGTVPRLSESTALRLGRGPWAAIPDHVLKRMTEWLVRPDRTLLQRAFGLGALEQLQTLGGLWDADWPLVQHMPSLRSLSVNDLPLDKVRWLPPELRSLTFENGRFLESDVVEAIFQRCPQLSELHVLDLGQGAAALLVPYLGRLSHLELRLTDKRRYCTLMNALAGNRTLQVLRLSGLIVEGRQAQRLADFIRGNNRLRKLDIEVVKARRIQGAFAPVIAAIKASTWLKEVSLSFPHNTVDCYEPQELQSNRSILHVSVDDEKCWNLKY